MAFEKIQATGQIKDYTRTDEGIKVKLKNVLFSDKARDQLNFWMDGEVEVRVTIETFQDALPRMDTEQADDLLADGDESDERDQT